MDEEVLHGGVANAGAVVRVGDYVLRPSNPHSASIHEALTALDSTGFGGASKPVGIDADGRERLEFIEGDVPIPPYPDWAQSDEALASVALLMKELHDDPTGDNGPSGDYGIPANNPFTATIGALDEIWAYGLRNPHRFSWDVGGEKMFIGNIGESNVDGVYLGQSAANYGWNEREGPFLFDPVDPENVYPLPPDDEAFGYTYPVAQYDHDKGFALVGGFVSRTIAIPELEGMYVFGDIVNGRIFHTDEADMITGATPAVIGELTLLDGDGTEVTMQGLAGSARVDLRFGTDAEENLYALAKANGKIWRVTSAASPPPDVECPGGEMPFVDVSADSFAFDDVVCIFGLGITTGTEPTMYSPAGLVTREQMAAFLGRLIRAD